MIALRFQVVLPAMQLSRGRTLVGMDIGRHGYQGLRGIGYGFGARGGFDLRRAARTDANHAQIIAMARKCGCTVLDLSKVGVGCPDLLLGIATASGRKNLLVEIKDGTKRPSERKLTPYQVKFHGAWKGPIAVVESTDELIALIRMQP